MSELNVKDLNEEEFIIYIAADQGIEEAIDYLCDKGIVLGSLMVRCNPYGTVEVSDTPIKRPERKAVRININFPNFEGDILSQEDNTNV
jgi:hypothetical protein